MSYQESTSAWARRIWFQGIKDLELAMLAELPWMEQTYGRIVYLAGQEGGLYVLHRFHRGDRFDDIRRIVERRRAQQRAADNRRNVSRADAAAGCVDDRRKSVATVGNGDRPRQGVADVDPAGETGRETVEFTNDGIPF